MIRINLEDKLAVSEWTEAGHLYIVLRDGLDVDEDGEVIRGGKDGMVYGPLRVDADVPLSDTADEYQAGQTEDSRHARDLAPYFSASGYSLTGAWMAMATYAAGIDAAQYDYELPFATGERIHVANSNAVVFSVLN
jgi:hypothetical protein